MNPRPTYTTVASPAAWDPTPPGSGSPQSWREWADALPIARSLGLTCIAIGPGEGSFAIEIAPVSANPNGSIHGGLLLAAADQCMGAVAMTVLEPGCLPVTASLHGRFHRPAVAPVTLSAHVRNSGRSLVFVDVEIEDAQGRLCTSAQGTMMSVERA